MPDWGDTNVTPDSVHLLPIWVSPTVLAVNTSKSVSVQPTPNTGGFLTRTFVAEPTPWIVAADPDVQVADEIVPGLELGRRARQHLDRAIAAGRQDFDAGADELAKLDVIDAGVDDHRRES